LGTRFLYCENNPPFLFTENETNNERIFGTPNAGPYVKDGIHRYLVDGQYDGVNPSQTGTKVSADYRLTVNAGQTRTIWLRLTDRPPSAMTEPFGTRFGDVVRARRSEADEFYRAVTPTRLSKEEARVMRQALAGMLWTKQYFGYDVDQW